MTGVAFANCLFLHCARGVSWRLSGREGGAREESARVRVAERERGGRKRLDGLLGREGGPERVEKPEGEGNEKRMSMNSRA